MWKQIDNLVHQSVHACELNQTQRSVETPDMELASLPDHINKGLQCIQTYQSRSQIPNPDPLAPHAHLVSGTNLRQVSHRNLDPCKFENDTGVELTHNQDPRYNKFNNVVDMIAYMDQTQYDNVSFTDDSANLSNTPTNKSALQRRYRIKRPPLPPPTKKMKSVPWIKIPDETIGMSWWFSCSMFIHFVTFNAVCKYRVHVQFLFCRLTIMFLWGFLFISPFNLFYYALCKGGMGHFLIFIQLKSYHNEIQ